MISVPQLDLSPILPQTFTVRFPTRVCPNGCTPRGGVAPPKYYTSSVALSTIITASAFTGSPGNYVVRDKMVATYDGVTSLPTNQAALDALARQLAKDFYNWRTLSYDLVYNGITGPLLDASIDALEIEYTTDNTYIRFTSSPWNGNPNEFFHNGPACQLPTPVVYAPKASVSGGMIHFPSSKLTETNLDEFILCQFSSDEVKNCCGEADCFINFNTLPIDACTATVMSGVTVVITNVASGAVVFSGIAGGVVSWTGPPGLYTIDWNVGPYVRRTFTTLVCGSNETRRQDFVTYVNIDVLGTYVTQSGCSLASATECLTTQVHAQVGGMDLITPFTTSLCINNNIPVLFDPGPTPTIDFFAIYLGTTCHGPQIGCTTEIIFETGNAVQLIACNTVGILGGPLVGATVVGPDGETVTSDACGIALIHPYTSAWCSGTVSWTVSKFRYTTTVISNPSYLTVYTINPEAGYACSPCCATPLKTTLFATITSTAGDTDTITLTYDPTLLDPRWWGCLIKAGHTVAGDNLPMRCVLPFIVANSSVYVLFGGNITGCQIAYFTSICPNLGVNREDSCSTDPEHVVNPGGGSTIAAGLVVVCPDPVTPFSFSATDGSSPVAPSAIGVAAFYFGNVSGVVTE